MNLKISTSNKKGLEIFQNDLRLFYSEINYRRLSKSVAIFNNKNEKLIEIKYGGFFMKTYKIISQSPLLKLKITAILDDEIVLKDNTTIERKRDSFAFRSKSAYRYQGQEIAKSEEKHWFWKKDFSIKLQRIDDALLDIVAIIVLTFENAMPVEE